MSGQTTEELARHVRRVVEAATVAEQRHPRCGAFAWLRSVLDTIPAELRADIPTDLPPHDEDDQIDGLAEVRRLTRENAELRRRLAEATGEQLDLFGGAR